MFWAKKLKNDEEWKWWANAYIGFIYDKKGNKEAAVTYLEKAVEYKIKTMCIIPPTHTYGTLGEMYYLGVGVNQDDSRALELLLREIEVSEPEDVLYCYAYVGYIYDDAQNYFKAFPYIKYAAENGDAWSQALMAKYYVIGESSEGRDYKKAEQWAQKVINNKDATSYSLGYSYRTLGNIYSYEDSVLCDIQKSIANYEKASSYNDNIASFLLGEIYENGKGEISKNFKLAEKYYRLAAEQGHEKAKEKLKLFQ